MMIVGDSFTYGFGVDEKARFSDLIEVKTGLNTFNVASPTHIKGYSELIKYARDNNIRSNKLLLAICMENDINDYEASIYTIINSTKQRNGFSIVN